MRRPESGNNWLCEPGPCDSRDCILCSCPYNYFCVGVSVCVCAVKWQLCWVCGSPGVYHLVCATVVTYSYKHKSTIPNRIPLFTCVSPRIVNRIQLMVFRNSFHFLNSASFFILDPVFHQPSLQIIPFFCGSLLSVHKSTWGRKDGHAFAGIIGSHF